MTQRKTRYLSDYHNYQSPGRGMREQHCYCQTLSDIREVQPTDDRDYKPMLLNIYVDIYQRIKSKVDIYVYNIVSNILPSKLQGE